MFSNQRILYGNWNIKNEEILSQAGGNKIKLNFSVKDVYLVAGDKVKSGKIKVLLNGEDITLKSNQKGGNLDGNSEVLVYPNDTFHLVSFDSLQKNQTSELIIPSGVVPNVFTFGGN